MALSRSDHQRLREIERRISAEDPEFVRRFVGEAVGTPAYEPVPKGAVALICAMVAFAALVLILFTAHAGREPTPPGPGPRAPGEPASRFEQAHATVPAERVPDETGAAAHHPADLTEESS
ncbi:DUF3040 domain-containing protein [Marinactinospora thermotolerans]|uniref:DUF3040 domain-containing protein n=1 Tax=Marinactinospora thermotolerans TaxID=531310 RepID=UPI003D9363EC